MANESESRLHSSVKINADGTIAAQTPALIQVTHAPNSGIYVLQYNEGIAETEECHEICVAFTINGEDTLPNLGGVVKNDEFIYEVHTYSPTNPDVVGDAAFAFTIWRISSSNGT